MQWQGLAEAQSGVLARRQLLGLGVDSDRVRNQVSAGRWALRSSTVLTCFTGPLSREQREWVGVLHPSIDGVVAGLDALRRAGLRGWDRPDVRVLVPADAHLPGPVAGIDLRTTRRSLTRDTVARGGPPRLAVEAAALLHASGCRSEREAQGLVAACVQQRLTTPTRLRDRLEEFGRLRRAPLLRQLVLELDGGAQSLAEVDVNRVCDAAGLCRPQRQVRRTDRDGRARWTDCEWQLRDGRRVVLEVDGAHHMSVDSWEDDLRRQRQLVGQAVLMVRCTARELRDDPDPLVRDLLALGVPRIDDRSVA